MAFQILLYTYQWFSTTSLKGQSDFKEYSFHYSNNGKEDVLIFQDRYINRTFTTQLDFHTSNNFVLTNCYLLNHWWIAIWMNGFRNHDIFYVLLLIQQQSSLFASTLEKAITIWFTKAPRKPPDKLHSTYKDFWKNSIAGLFFTLEDILYHCFGVTVDVNIWIYTYSNVLWDYLQDLIQIILDIDFNSSSDRSVEWKNPSLQPVIFHNASKRYTQSFKHGKIVISQVVLSLSARSNQTSIDDSLISDTDSYQFAIDTCTSFHINKHKELYVGEIKPCKNIFVQGVGGKIKVSGYGTMKLRLTDDNGQLHDILVHDVLYVPESPTNLFSPQQWSKSSSSPSGTGELTTGGTTLLFWDDNKYTKLIPHHPDLGIPIMSVNDGYTKGSTFFNLMKANTSMLCQPCNVIPAYLNTSQPITVSENAEEVHIIPVDDDELSISNLPSSASKLVVDELDMIPTKKRPTLIEDTAELDELDALENQSISTSSTQIPDDFSTCTSDDEGFDIAWDEDREEEKNTIEIPDNEIDAIISSVDEKTSELQRELLTHHYRLKHLPFSALKKLAQKGVLPKKLASVTPPLCYPCIMGKQHRKPWRGRGKKSKQIRKATETFPGANTSTDQMISPFGGLIPQVKGRLMKAKFYAATIFVDHFTDFAYVHLMKDTTAESTLEAKNAYEHLLQTFSRKVLAYHADNGRFAEKVFKQDVKDKAQDITFCGVGSHHQNGIAERRIKSFGEDARTMLAHGQHLWPEVVTKSFWPFAYKAACRSRNKFNLDDDGLSPEEKMSGIQVRQELKNEHTLFCPVYVLNGKLQSGIGGIPKWNPRSNAGVFLGHSPEHASNVALVLNLATGLVSPQYHVVFDDSFSTVDFIRSRQEPSNWETLCKYHSENFTMDAAVAAPSASDTLTQEIESAMLDVANEEPDSHIPVPSNQSEMENGALDPISIPPEGDGDDLTVFDTAADDFVIPFDDADPLEFPTDSAASASEGVSERVNPAMPPEGDVADPPPPEDDRRRSSRIRKPTYRMLDPANASLKNALGYIAAWFSQGTPTNPYVAFKATMTDRIRTHQAKLLHYDTAVELNVDGSFNNLHPLSLAAQTVGNDVYYFHQAMQQDDRDDFIQAMIKELQDHQENGHWKLVRRSEIGKATTIKAIWSFKRKRRPDGSILKHKARLCAHGGMQVHGENYWDTYAPVVNWISIRMMLTIAVIHKMYTTSIDFTLAFPQADTDVTIYMEVPIGCEVPEGDFVCKLIKNLYGLKQAARTWFEYLRDSLTEHEDTGGFGFKQSLVDPCIFYKDGVTLITWVDDCLIFARKKELADKVIEELKGKFTLTEDEDVSAYLGILMKIDEENETVEMTQPFLIQRIIDLLGDAVKDANIKDTPSVYKEILTKDEHGPERKQDWSYRSAIGMLNYLAATTRPDCLFAVHQCARFSSNPKLSHERAVKRIIRYLKGTKDKGIILKPNPSEGVKCYVDADFAGGYSSESCEDPVGVFSRTGYVIFYYGCPIVWISKLQSEISLSTVEAEYIALSQSMRDVIPLIDLIRETDQVYGKTTEKPELKCTLFEDNNGALNLAAAPRYRPRTKHIAIKYHHFREHIKNGTVTVSAIDTKDQIADQFTKGLQVSIFKFLRTKLLGW
jgi:hypothetical protein